MMSKRMRELNDKIRNALYGTEIRSAFVEAFTFVDRANNFRIILLIIQCLVLIMLNKKSIFLKSFTLRMNKKR